jgi:hypothetical protein
MLGFCKICSNVLICFFFFFLKIEIQNYWHSIFFNAKKIVHCAWFVVVCMFEMLLMWKTWSFRLNAFALLSLYKDLHQNDCQSRNLKAPKFFSPCIRTTASSLGGQQFDLEFSTC